MLTDRDMQRINRDVANIISDWDVMVQLWTPLPRESQPDWDPIMHEMTGPILYDKIIDIPAEKKDIDLSGLIVGSNGDKHDGNISLHIPSTYMKNGVNTNIVVLDDMLIIIDGNEKEPWRIHNMFTRPGETVVAVHKMVGE